MLLQLSLCTLLAATSCVADQRLNSNDPLDPLSINDLAKKSSVKLDPKLRKALLKILTRLDEEDKQVDEIRQQQLNQQQQILLSSTPIPTILPASKIQDTSKENIVLFPTPNSQTDELNLKVNSSKIIEKIPTVLSRSQIDFFQVPLLTAFTLQQDFNGIPRNVIPIYTEPEQLERQKIQALEVKQEEKKEKNSIETEKNKLETLKHTELSQHSQQTGRPLLPITTLETNLPQNSFHHHQLTIQQLQQQLQTQFKPRYIESGLTQQSIQQPQTIQDQIIQSQQILRQQPNQQQPLQNQIIQSHQNQLQFTPQQPINLPPSKLDFFPQQPAQFLFTQQQTILPQITRSQHFQLEPSKQQFFQPNVVKNQFSHTQIIPSQQYQLQQYQQIQPNSFDQQQLFQQRQIEFKPELFTQQTRVLRQPQETLGYGISVPKLPDDLNVVYKVLALNHRHRNT